MSRFADAGRCPDCACLIDPHAERCPGCSLPLRGALAHELYLTLERADQLLESLRALVQQPVSQPVAQPAPAASPARGASAAGSRLVSRRAALSSASVPQLLLSLGALCLLVAALVFLAVTWSVMGVGGRTATLVGFTAVSATVTGLVARSGLRGASEAMGLVTLGLVALDVAGGDHAGWYGDLALSSFLVVLGAALAGSATAACLAVRSTPSRSFTGGEVVLGLATGLVAAGMNVEGSATSAQRPVLALLLAAAATAATHRLRLSTATPLVASVTGFAWLALVEVGLSRVAEDLTLGHLWGDLAAWPLVVAALFLVALALVVPVSRGAREGALSVGVAILALVLVCPALDNGATAATLAVLTALGVALAALWALPRRWSAAAALTAAIGTVVAAVQALLLAGAALDQVAFALASGGSLDDRLPTARLVDGLQPWLLLPDVGLTIAAVLVARRILGSTVPVRFGVEVAVLAAASATAALHPVPVWTVVAGLLVAGLLLVVVDHLGVAAVALATAVVVATYSDGLTAIALGTVLVSSAGVHLRDRRNLVVAAAGAVTAATLAASVWTWGDLLARPGEWAAAVSIVVVSVLALLRPDPGVEGGAAIGVVGVSVAGVLAAPAELAPTWVSVYLTLAGAATCVQALLREDRRQLGWVGGLLLAAASWTRLADVGVRDPEPYTLPPAVALLVLGVVQLLRHAEEDSMKALGPGLGLALTPSLLWVLDDPTTLRTLVLGLACLALVVSGSRLRWTAPLLLGSVVGAAIVLRSAAPYVGDAVPRWATIGTAGVLLVALGITWEQRVREARVLAGYVRQLR